MSTAPVATAPPEWVEHVAADLDRLFGPGATDRGRAYAAQGRVRQLVVDGSGRTMLATVQGSGRSVYQTLISGERRGDVVLCETRCSCPVGSRCKHAVAVLLEAKRRRGMTARTPDPAPWEALLAPLAAGPPAAAPGQITPGLLLLWPSGGPLPAPGEPVELRPVRRGASGKWVKSDMSWQSVRYKRGLPEAVAAAYQAMATGTASHRYGGYVYADMKVTLGDLGAQAVTLLGTAAAAGIALIAPDQRRLVRTVEAAAAPRFDARRAEDQSISVTATWRLDEEVWAPAEVRLIGTPPTSLVAARDGELVIAALAAPDAAVLPLATAGGLTVPAADTARFLTAYYPLLHRRAEVTSSDASVPPPTVVAPRLWLEVGVEAGHRLELRWGFAYGVGSDALRFDLTEPPGGPARPVDIRAALRQRETEARLVAEAVALIQPHVPGIIWPNGPHGHPQPYGSSGLVGMDSALFAARVVPALRAHPDIDVLVIGDLPDYREVTAPPQVLVAVRDAGDAGDGRTDWFDLDIRVELDGVEVPFRPLLSALALGEDHLLLESGVWFALDRPELAHLRRLVEEARALSDREGPLRISRWQAGLWDELTDLAASAEQAQAWTAAVGGLLDPAALAPAPVPDGLVASLRPYQLDGYRWLRYLWEQRLGGILADDMGLGKTVQALAAILATRAPGDDPVLVVAPTSVIGTWVAEAAKFAPGLRVVTVTETAGRRGADLDAVRAGADVVVTSYALVRIEAEDYRAAPWSAVLLDEAQFVKNPRARTHQVVRSLPAPVKVAMTGTPLENSLMDLWALLSITAPGLFPRAEAFTELYRRPIEAGTDPQALARLQRRLRPLMLRRTKEVVAPELPPKQEQVVRVDLAPAHRRLYDRHLQRERQRVLGLLSDFEKNRIAIFRALTLLRQLALAPSLVEPEGPGAKVPATKIEAFAEQIAEVAAEGHRALVFSQFTGFLALVRERLEADGIDYAYLDGRTRDRPARIAAWREGAAPVFLISLKAGGFGLTLTEADYVFVLDPWWNPAAEAQAVDRTHRIGQTNTVMVYRLIAADTIEEKVLALQERKRELFTRVVDDGGAVDAMLTADDIRGLLEA